jgi:tryptophan halogenase
MKIAVIGAGTAGSMAAAMVSHRFPDAELYHIYDPSIPTIGVGEGTVVTFPMWLHQLTRLSEDSIRERCGITRKYGITFENWGPAHQSFLHHFTPAEQAYSYHISASGIVELLNDYIHATRIEKKVERVDSDGRHVTIRVEGGTTIGVDVAFDARGFPPMTDPDVYQLAIVPTNAAHIRSGPPVHGQATTRAVARPHGWIFIIPLKTRTAYGYIYNADISTREAVDADLLEFLDGDGVQPNETVRDLRFPNFTRRRFFDGALFSIGNRASFLEPLEATALAIVWSQIEAARLWPLDAWRVLAIDEKTRAKNIETLNRFFFRHVLKAALFVGWHYSTGSAFKSPFWDYAVSNYQRHVADFVEPAVMNEFNRYVRSASQFHSLAQYDGYRVSARTASHARITDLFGGWPPESFVEMYNGLDCRSVQSAGHPC